MPVSSQSAGRLKGRQLWVAFDQLFPEVFGGKDRGKFEIFFGKSRGQAGLGKVEDPHGSTAEGGHGSGRFVSAGELVVLRFIGQRLTEEFGRSGAALAHGLAEIDLAVASEAGPDFPIGGEPQLVAGGAEVGCGEGPDETEGRAGVGVVKVAGGAVAWSVVGERLVG